MSEQRSEDFIHYESVNDRYLSRRRLRRLRLCCGSWVSVLSLVTSLVGTRSCSGGFGA